MPLRLDNAVIRNISAVVVVVGRFSGFMCCTRKSVFPLYTLFLPRRQCHYIVFPPRSIVGERRFASRVQLYHPTRNIIRLNKSSRFHYNIFVVLFKSLFDLVCVREIWRLYYKKKINIKQSRSQRIVKRIFISLPIKFYTYTRR